MAVVDLRTDPIRETYGRAEATHYTWQTRGAFVAERERELVRAAFLPLGTRVLDVGCGEGATLFHLDAPTGAVGLDLFADKLAFASKELPTCRFVLGSATELPFDDGAFDHVIVRDVIHHLPEPKIAIAEIARVLSAKGRVDVLEPCRNNPLIFAHGAAIRVERGELRSTKRYLSGLLAPYFDVSAHSRHQPLPVHRLLFHPDMGWRRLAERPLARALVSAFEGAMGVLLPKACWAYLHLRATKAT